MSSDFQQFLQNKCIISQRTCPRTPRQNGVTDRKNRHLFDVTRSLLLESSVPTRFWVESLATAAHLIDCMPSTSIKNQSPYYRLYKTFPSYYDLRVFGSVCFVHLPPSERTKLTTQSAKCAFLGYTPFQKGFLCYDPHIRCICTSRNVVFFEKKIFFQTHLDPPDSSISLPGFSNDTSIARFNLTLCITDEIKKSLQTLPFLIFLQHPIHLRHLVHLDLHDCAAPLKFRFHQTAMGSFILP